MLAWRGGEAGVWLGEGKRELFWVMEMLHIWLWWWLQVQAFVKTHRTVQLKWEHLMGGNYTFTKLT